MHFRFRTRVARFIKEQVVAVTLKWESESKEGKKGKVKMKRPEKRKALQGWQGRLI